MKRSKSREGCGRSIGPFGCCTVVCGDALELLKRLPRRSIGAVVTDPPYGTQLLVGSYGRKGRTIANDCDLSLTSDCVPYFMRVLRRGSWFMTFCAPRKMLDVGDIVRNAGFTYCGEIVWNKRNAALGYGPVRYSHESILLFSKGTYQKNGSIFSVIEGSSKHHDVEDHHVHEKPVRVVMRLVSMTQGIVLDPFCGTGSVLVAAKTQARHFLGFELEPHYVDEARTRIENCSVIPIAGRKNDGAYLYHEMGANE